LGKSAFDRLNEVRINDVIVYKINNTVKCYKVRKNIIIDKVEVNEYINTFEEKNMIKLFGIIKANENKIRYAEAVEFN
jgi:sortase (surface protein transpeptidase)